MLLQILPIYNDDLVRLQYLQGNNTLDILKLGTKTSLGLLIIHVSEFINK